VEELQAKEASHVTQGSAKGTTEWQSISTLKKQINNILYYQVQQKLQLQKSAKALETATNEQQLQQRMYIL